MNRRAAKGIWYTFLSLFLLLSLRLGWIMIVEHDALTARAEAQQISSFPYYAYERGAIADREGRFFTDITENCAVVFPAMIYDKDAAVQLLRDTLCLPEQDILFRLNAAQGETALILKTGLAPDIAEALRDAGVNGVTSLALPARYDAFRTGVHIIGSCQQEDGVWHGISGLEAEYDSFLMGRSDERIMAYVDARGAFSNEQMYLIPGKEDYATLNLALDRDIQQITEQIFESHGCSGGCVIMDPATGDVLATVSAPEYDPYYWEIPAEGDYLNKALSFYAPASTFKTILAAAALTEQTPLPQTEGYEHFYCSGSYQLADGHTVFCTSAAEGHGEVDLSKALSLSCNCYFVALGQALGGDALLHYSDLFGYGEQVLLGYDAASESGRIRFLSSVPASVANASLGEEGVAVSPLQQAAAYCCFVNGGKLVTPRLVTSVTDSSGTVLLDVPSADGKQIISAETAAAVKDMLCQTVEEGTGTAAQYDGLTTGGKTGTGETDGVWFVGFAEENGIPLYVISVYVEDGTAGGREAAQIFKEIVSRIDSLME